MLLPAGVSAGGIGSWGSHYSVTCRESGLGEAWGAGVAAITSTAGTQGWELGSCHITGYME